MFIELFKEEIPTPNVVVCENFEHIRPPSGSENGDL